MVDTARLSGKRLAEFERDREESNRRYDHAFNVVLSHTSAIELKEFWRLFAATSAITLDPHDTDFAFHSNPTMTFEGENPLALAGETNEPIVRKQAL